MPNAKSSHETRSDSRHRLRGQHPHIPLGKFPHYKERNVFQKRPRTIPRLQSPIRLPSCPLRTRHPILMSRRRTSYPCCMNLPARHPRRVASTLLIRITNSTVLPVHPPTLHFRFRHRLILPRAPLLLWRIQHLKVILNNNPNLPMCFYKKVFSIMKQTGSGKQQLPLRRARLHPEEVGLGC